MNKSERPAHVLIADSQFLTSESLRTVLSIDPRFSVNRIVAEKSELIHSLKHGNISILIIDPTFFDISGIADLKEIIQLFPELKIMVITNNVIRKELHELNNLGITNIILKTADREELDEALNALLKSKKYYSNELLELLFEPNERKSLVEESGQLTNSEIEIVRLISDGLTTKEIASRKFISFHTVISHRKNIFRKLGVNSISELIMYAIKAGWINTIEYNI
jgi:DNA-binding NarL/FixJ family response regulator